MGTASTMNAVAEALGLSLPGARRFPLRIESAGQMAYATDRPIVDNGVRRCAPETFFPAARSRTPCRRSPRSAA